MPLEQRDLLVLPERVLLAQPDLLALLVLLDLPVLPDLLELVRRALLAQPDLRVQPVQPDLLELERQALLAQPDRLVRLVQLDQQDRQVLRQQSLREQPRHWPLAQILR